MTILADAGVVESPRQFFRRYLQQNTTRGADLAWYLDQSVPHLAGNAEVKLAVEELVDRLGHFLGFRCERGDRDDHAVWTSDAGHFFLVWIVDDTSAVAAVGSGLHARDRALATIDIGASDRLSCLYVVCGPVDERRLNDAVNLRRAWRHVRLITIGALIEVSARLEAGLLDAAQVVSLLQPASALADGAVALLPPIRRP